MNRCAAATALLGIDLAAALQQEAAMGIFEEIQKFIEEHRPCGEVTGRAQPPTVQGYRVWMVCTCGEMLDRWVTPEAARHDLIYSSLLVLPN